jgi:hypothetical protein
MISAERCVRKMLLFLQCVLPLVVAALPTRSHRCAPKPHEHYVATRGSDANDGSACRPWATIQHAADRASPGDTVLVDDGTYEQTVLVTRGGASGHPITFKSRHRWKAMVAPESANNNGNIFEIETGYVNVQDFEITGIANRAGNIARGIRSHNGYSDVNITGNKVHNLGNGACVSGAGIMSGANHSLITGNYIYDIGLPYSDKPHCPWQHGIYGAGNETGAYYANNVIFKIYQGYAVHLNDVAISNITFTNNTIFNVGNGDYGGAMVFECGGGTCDYLTFSNNVISNDRGSRSYGCFGETIARGSGGVFGSHNTFSNNMVDGSCPMSRNLWQSGNRDVNTVIADPHYVRYTGDEAGDYHLQSGSPAVHKARQKVGFTNKASTAWPPGTSNDGCVFAPLYDHDGLSRNEDAVDIGAYSAHPPESKSGN